MGFPLRNNKKAIRHCLEGKFWLKKVFLQESSNQHDAFQVVIKYLVTDPVEKAKHNFTNIVLSDTKHDLGVLIEDLNDLLDYLELALSKKKMSEL